MHQTVGQVETGINMGYPFNNRRSKLNLRNKRSLYKACPLQDIMPCIMTAHVEMLERTQNEILRMIANAPWFIRNQLNRRDFKVEISLEWVTKRDVEIRR